jgi:thiamine biosynthesis protein ThiI
MHPPGADVVLVRHGDITTKSASVQASMEQRLVDNLQAALEARDLPGTVERHWSRPRVYTEPEAVAAVTEVVAETFGVVSASASVQVEPSLDAIENALAETAAACYDGGTFRVSAKRADKSRPYTSEDVERRGGEAVMDAVADRDPVVDLDDPDQTFGVEVRDEGAFVYAGTLAGPGGMPLGSQAPLVALVSGGIDSPVATFEAMKRGSPVVPVYLALGDYGGPDHEARAFETVRTLAERAPGFDVSVHRVPAGETVAHLAATMEGGRMLAFRRFMFRVAEHVAAETGASGIVTGEAVGQKSSQTVANLAVTSEATTLPVHRPLLSFDKHEITERARAIGTFDDSTIPAGCERFAPSRPVTDGTLAEQRRREPDDLFERARRAADQREVVPLDDRA